ncbi:MAG TPA: hypothetical protein VMS32_10115 [Verrucomicrobiae bacterium]|nr:hypothetical protein [Verrucomicrobiae bacterium]
MNAKSNQNSKEVGRDSNYHAGREQHDKDQANDRKGAREDTPTEWIVTSSPVATLTKIVCVSIVNEAYRQFRAASDLSALAGFFPSLGEWP